MILMEAHVFDAGHLLLETHSRQAAELMLEFVNPQSDHDTVVPFPRAAANTSARPRPALPS